MKPIFLAVAAILTLGCPRTATGPLSQTGSLSIVAPPESESVDVRLGVWTPVPGLSTGVFSGGGDNLEISVSAEMFQPGGTVFFRALVDGKVAQPSDVAFKAGSANFDGTRSFTFVQPNPGGGQHLVEIQWISGSNAAIKDRTLVVYSESAISGRNRLSVVAAPSGPDVVKSSASWEEIPGLNTTIVTTSGSTLAIVFSAEGGADSGRMMVRATVDGTAVGEVLVSEAGNAGRGGTRSYTFSHSGAAGNHRIALQWRADGGVSRVGDRTLSVSAVDAGSQEALMFEPSNATTFTTQWTDIPADFKVGFVATDPVTNVAVSFSGEARSNEGRLFVRALIDDQPANPGDVVLIQGGDRWRAASHNFVVKNVAKGLHKVRLQARADAGSRALIRKHTVRVLFKRRSGSDFVQPFLGMAPLRRNLRTLVLCFDPLREGQVRPTIAQVKATFDQTPGGDPHPNFRGWLAENSNGVAAMAQVHYAGCTDGSWYTAPPQHRGLWYWTQTPIDVGFAQMREDALRAADADVDYHAYDTDHDDSLSTDELVVIVVLPQEGPSGAGRWARVAVDGNPEPLGFTMIDLYLSSFGMKFRAGVGTTAHEISHHLFDAVDLYGVCAEVSPSLYSIMDKQDLATHLDPFEKMKNGLLQPIAIDLSTQESATMALAAVESRYQVLLLHHPDRVGREYFLVENRYPGDQGSRNYDELLSRGWIVVWQIFEQTSLTATSAVCPGDVRFIRKRAVLGRPEDTFELTWSDGTSAGFSISAPISNAELAKISLQKF